MTIWPLLFLSTSLSQALAAPTWPDLSTPPPATGIGVNDAAVVVGIEDYLVVQDIAGARQNAKDWYFYLVKSLGVPIDRVKLLIDTPATREAVLAAARTGASQVQPGGRLWFVFIGHGAPAPDGKDGILVGSDTQQNADSLMARGILQGDLTASMATVPSILVLDTCFSGKSQDGGALVPGLQPMVPIYSLPGSATVLTAARGDQFAGPLPGIDRPAFSYLMLGALRGWGDIDKDGQVTLAEATDWSNTAMVATIQGRQQTPELRGDGSFVGGSATEAGPDLAEMAVVSAMGTSRSANPPAVAQAPSYRLDSPLLGDPQSGSSGSAGSTGSYGSTPPSATTGACARPSWVDELSRNSASLRQGWTDATGWCGWLNRPLDNRFEVSSWFDSTSTASLDSYLLGLQQYPYREAVPSECMATYRRSTAAEALAIMVAHPFSATDARILPMELHVYREKGKVWLQYIVSVDRAVPSAADGRTICGEAASIRAFLTQ